MALKFQKLEEEYLSLLSEFNTLKVKLECKTDSLLILGHELEQCQSEKDQYKLMAEQLRERYSALKRRVEGWGPSLLGVYDVDGLKCDREKSLAHLLCELKDQNKTLKFKTENLKLQLDDARGDIKLLRDELSKHQAESLREALSENFLPLKEKEALIKQLETQNLKCKQLTQDLQAVLDEKEELVTARDQYRHKYERLNQQLNYILRGDQQTLIDIDGVLLENKYLQERIKQVEEEKAVMTSSLAKCKALLEKKRAKGGMRSTIASGLAVSAKQVEQLLQNKPFLDLVNKSPSAAEFHNLVITLLEALSDKSIALSHQKKTNKILGNRVKELQEKIKSMEVSTSLRIPDATQLSLLFHDCDHDNYSSTEKNSPLDSIVSSVDNERKDSPENILDDQSIRSDDQCSVSELSTDLRSHSGFSDLDILPTKDYSVRDLKFDRRESMSSCSRYSDSRNSSGSPSPFHTSRTLHSDSEITPKKSLSASQLCKSTFNKDRHQWSSLDVDDLPPKLQKFIAAAFAEIEDKKDCDETIVKSPLHKLSTLPSMAKNNPKC